MRQRSKAERWTMEALNEFALLAHHGQSVAGHFPSSPIYWFNGLARELGAAKLLGDAGIREQLLPTTIRRLERMVAA